jgi:hypothetical protein
VFLADGVTQANIDVGNVDASQITQGNSLVAFDGVDGNAFVTIDGSNVMYVDTTGIEITGNVNTSGNQTYNLGNTTNQWNDLWLSRIYMQDIPLTMVGVGLASNLQVNGANVLVQAANGNTTLANIIISGNASIAGTVVTVGNITGGNINTPGDVVATGDISGDNISAAGNAAVTGNISGGNISTSGTITATGNITGGNLLTVGNAEVGGILTDNYYFANGAPLDFERPAGGNRMVQYNDDGDFGASANFAFNSATGGLFVEKSFSNTLQSNTSYTVFDGNVGGNFVIGGNVTAASNVSVGGNLDSGNFSTPGLIGATGNISGGNILTGGEVIATGNVTGSNIATAVTYLLRATLAVTTLQQQVTSMLLAMLLALTYSLVERSPQLAT